MRRGVSKAIWLVIIAGFAALLAYGFMPTPHDVQVVRPEIGSLQITVNDDGETRIRENYVISVSVAGKMLRVDLQEGDSVLAGETEIARIQPSDPSLLDARTRAEAEARVQVATAAYTHSRSEVDRAKESLDLAKREFERAKQLIESRAMSQSEFDVKDNALRLAYADLRSAESALSVAGYEIDQAKAAVEYITSTFDPNDKNLFKVIAPISGKVLEVYREDSGVVESGTPIVRIGDPSDLEIVIDILSTDAVKVRPGDKVIIEHWGGEQPLAAVVRLVEPSAFLKVSALGVEEKRVNVIADFVDPVEERMTLGDGFRIEARIVVDETPDDSLKVPSGVLFRKADKWHAFRVVEGVAEQLDVVPGRSNGIETEVLSGITKDDPLVLHPSELIQSGTRVRF